MSDYDPLLNDLVGHKHSGEEIEGGNVGSVVPINSIQFDTTPDSITNAEGLLRWNSTDGTLDLGMSGGDITLQIGQEMFTKVRNVSGSTILNGTPVYVSGRTGNRPNIYPARSDSATTSKVIGVTTQDISSPADGFVTTIGYVRQIKTDYSGTGNWGTTWVEGDRLYVSKTIAGQLTNVEPTAPHHSDVIGTVEIIGGAGIGSILVRNQLHQTLEELTDVDGTPLTTSGQILVWDQTAGYWDPTKNINDYALLTQVILKSPTAIESNLITIPNATYKGLVIKGAPSQTTNLQEWQNSSGTVLSAIDKSGKIGAGTSSPTASLEAKAIPGVVDIFKITNSAGNAAFQIDNFTLNAKFWPGSIGSIPGISSTNDTNTGFSWSGSDVLTILTGGTERFRVDSSGNIGIGTNSPTARLFIDGTADDEQLVIQAHSSQTANLTEWQNSSGTVLGSVNGTGMWGLGTSPSTKRRLIVKFDATTAGDIGGYIDYRNSVTSGFTNVGLQVFSTSSIAENSTAELIGIGGSTTTQDTTYNNGEMKGLKFFVTNAGTGTISTAYGTQVGIQITKSGVGVITNGYSYYTAPEKREGTIVNWTGYRIGNEIGTNGSITNAYGLYFENIDVGSTLNYAILTNAGNVYFNNGGDASSDLRWSSDTETNMFFGDANGDTDGKLYLGGIAGTAIFKGGRPFGDLHVHDASAGAQSIASGATYTKLTCWTDTTVSNLLTASAANDKITITKPGFYRVSCQISFSSGTNNVEFKASAFLNGVEQDQAHFQRKISTAGDIGSASFIGIVDVTTANWDLDVRMAHDNAGAIDVTIKYGQLVAEYIGET